MKLDYDLIKQILERIETDTDGVSRHTILKSEYEGDEEQWTEFKALAYHYKILINNGFVDGEVLEIVIQGHRVPTNIDFFALTLDGHKLLDSMRNETLWNKVNDKLQGVGVEGLKQIPSLAIQLLTGA